MTSFWETLFHRPARHPRPACTTPPTHAARHWPLRREERRSPAPASNRAGSSPECHRIELSFPHLVEVNRVTQALLGQLRCDTWYVACQHESEVIIRLLRDSVGRYALCYHCRPGVEKAVYHGARAWGLSIIPLQAEDNLGPGQIAATKAALAHLPSEH